MWASPAAMSDRRAAGSARAGDRPADDQDRRAVVERLLRASRRASGRRRRRRPGGCRARRRSRPARPIVRCAHFRARADDPVETGVPGQSRRAARPGPLASLRSPDRARSPASRLVSTVTATTLVAGGAAALAAASISRPPAAWTVRIAGSKRRERRDRLGDGIRDVVQLEVEEDRQAELRQRAVPRRVPARRRIRGRASRRRPSRALLSQSRSRDRGQACRSRRRSGSCGSALRPDRRLRGQRPTRLRSIASIRRRSDQKRARMISQVGQEAEQEGDQQQDAAA